MRSECPHGDDRQLLEVNLEYREIGLGIAADDIGLGHAPVAQRHLDGVGAADDVVIGEDVTLIAHDDAGAKAAFDLLARRDELVAPAPEKLAEHGIVEERVWAHRDQLGGIDVDHRRRGLLHRDGVGGGAAGTRRLWRRLADLNRRSPTL